MPQARLILAPEMLLDLMLGNHRAINAPADLRAVRAAIATDYRPGDIHFLVESDEFSPTAPGGVLPFFDLQIERIERDDQIKRAAKWIYAIAKDHEECDPTCSNVTRDAFASIADIANRWLSRKDL